jgi:hypothetical protein
VCLKSNRRLPKGGRRFSKGELDFQIQRLQANLVFSGHYDDRIEALLYEILPSGLREIAMTTLPLLRLAHFDHYTGR